MAIRAKLVIIIFIFAILPMFFLTARSNSTAIGSVTASLREKLDENASRIVRNIDQAIRTRRNELAELADSILVKGYVRQLAVNEQALPDERVRNEILGPFLLAHHEQYKAIICVNQAGHPLFQIETGRQSDGAIRAYFSEHGLAPPEAEFLAAVRRSDSDKAADPVTSEIMHDAEGAYLSVGLPLRTTGSSPGRDSFAGVLLARLRLGTLLTEAAGPRAWYAVAQGNKAGEMGRSAIILDQSGVVLYAADEKKQGRRFQESFPDFAPAFASTLQQSEQRRLDNDIWPVWGINWLIRNVSRPGKATPDNSPAARMQVLLLENHTNAVKDLEFAGFTMFLLTIALAIVLTLLLYYLISGITDSIRRVTRGARAITAGRLDHRIKVKTSDETRVLAESFNRMAERLREMIARESEQKQFESFARLSAVLTHDLKNSIFSLSLLVQNMERKFDREGFREDAMRTLSNSVGDLQGLVARLSDPLAQSTQRQTTDLSEIVDRVLKRIGEHADARYEITRTLLPQLSASVDARAVERVVENLMINALEAMPDGGKLHVATRVENEAAIIVVRDTGRGMTEDFIRERLFRPFATTKKKGIGLGLYSCRDIIEQHGGRIEVSSRINEGTEFQVILPLEAEQLAAAAHSEDESLNGKVVPFRDGALRSASATRPETIAINETR